ncbi:hypothetical protein EX30DRAFT_33752 [Ascodesmis nigricans]|uniref:Uncharacterized protein n=1 Tax=Ascodesmis nigricans TaxID=341454 RepID=A0A4S2MWS0_9PEZI|nr:hypothetical protein EX30DRAFT_33752 [Ascodesmis nigricans]
MVRRWGLRTLQCNAPPTQSITMAEPGQFDGYRLIQKEANIHCNRHDAHPTSSCFRPNLPVKGYKVCATENFGVTRPQYVLQVFRGRSDIRCRCQNESDHQPELAKRPSPDSLDVSIDLSHNVVAKVGINMNFTRRSLRERPFSATLDWTT